MSKPHSEHHAPTFQSIVRASHSQNRSPSSVSRTNNQSSASDAASPVNKPSVRDTEMFLYLAEMFENLSFDEIEQIMLTSPSLTLQGLIDACLNYQTTNQRNNQSNNNRTLDLTSDDLDDQPGMQSDTRSSNRLANQPFEMVTLTPASTERSEPKPLSSINQSIEAINQSIAQIRQTLQSTNQPVQQQITFLQTMIKIIDNILHPKAPQSLSQSNSQSSNQAINQSVEKYRILTLSNPAFQSKVLSFFGALSFLLAIGFVSVQTSTQSHSQPQDEFLMIEGESREVLLYGRSCLDNLLQSISQSVDHSNPKGEGKFVSQSPQRSIVDNPLYQNKRDWTTTQTNNQSINQLPSQQRRPTREQLAELAERRAKPGSANQSAAPSINLPPGQGVRRGVIMDLDATRKRRAEISKMRAEKHSEWRNDRSTRQRVFTMSDIERMRKNELDAHAKFGTGMLSDDAYNEIGKAALKYTNEFRVSEGLDGDVCWHQGLAEIGWGHSRDMGDGKQSFSHDGFDDRVRRYPMPHRGAGENLYMAQGIDAASIARAAVDGWINSPGHRKNLLGRWNYCGIGVYRNSAGAFYLTQMFALA